MGQTASKLLAALVGLLLLFASAAAEAKTTYRWMDESGEIKYGEAPPRGVPYWVSRDGAVWQRREPETSVEPEVEEEAELEPLLTPQEKKAQQDILLLARYRTIEDIQLARQLELDYLKLDERTEREELRNLNEYLYAYLRAAADRQRAGLPVEAQQRRQIETVRRRLRSTEQTRDAHRARRTAIDEKYELEMQRFQELKGNQDAGP
jgi:hypothetical protein